MTALPRFAEEQLPDGVYIGLESAVYFGQERLGSTDLEKLHSHREGWWHQSRYNPIWAPEQTVFQAEGEALHAAILEGMDAYEERFVVGPERKLLEGVIDTIPEIKAALERVGKFPTKDALALRGWTKAPSSKGEWCDWCALAAPELPLWETIQMEFEDRRMNRQVLTRDQDLMVRMLAKTGRESEAIAALTGWDGEFPSLNELSFFWTDDRGVGRRARFDMFLPRFTGDLKSFGNWEGRDLSFALGDRINKMGYDIQVADQHDARQRLYKMVAETGGSCMTGGTDEQQAFLAQIVDRGERWEWFWLFYQKPDAVRGRAPIIFPLREPWSGPYHRSGFRKASRAIGVYLECVERFGLHEFWRRVERTHHTAPIDGYPDEPTIQLPHYGFDDEPVEGEGGHFGWP